MDGIFNLVPLIVLIPLGGLLINLFAGRKLGETGVGIVASGAAGLSFLISVLMWVGLAANDFAGTVVPFMDWIKIPAVGLSIPWEFRVDTLSVTMMLVVSGVGTLIHIYAIGYMHGDERFPRFFVYLNLFLASMLTLVSGNNYAMLFVGWELVGLCSFLLIGFWFDKAGYEGIKNSNAASKAFIVNRVGDFGMIMAILLTFWTFGTVDFGPVEAPPAHEAEMEVEEAGEAEEVAESVGVFALAEQFVEEDRTVPIGPMEVPVRHVIVAITLLFLLGATGKSAQIPLFVWLPDAMAGPTPVSALIHAATMVTAGIYMITRSNVLYEIARGIPILPFGLTTPGIVAIIGAATAFVAGTIAMAQWDIKRVLAYSTISQLGFMVAAVGVGGYVAGMFHLATHAFFKALLFLSAGSVIHGMEHGHHHISHGGHDDDGFDPQDMRYMGGLWGRMRITSIVYIVGALALAGIFPLAGFWSKDEILADALNRGGTDGNIAFALLTVAAGFTAFYMGRQVLMIFFGKPRHAAAEHAVESPAVMTWPLIGLAVLSVIGGIMNLPGVHTLSDWLGASVHHAHAGEFNPVLAGGATLLALVALALAYAVYGRKAVTDDMNDPLASPLGPIWKFLNGKWYWDEFYDVIAVGPFNVIGRFLADTVDWELWHDGFHDKVLAAGFNRIGDFLANPFDLGIIDGIVNGIARVVGRLGGAMRGIQNGYVRSYAFSIFLGVVFVVIVILVPVVLAG